MRDPGSYWKLALEVLESQDSPRVLRERSVRSLYDLFLIDCGDELPQSAGLSERIIAACVDEMKRSYVDPPRDPDIERTIAGTIQASLCWMQGRSVAIANLINDEHFLPWVIQRIHDDHPKLHEYAMDLLDSVCCWGSHGDRVTMIIRYGSSLQSAFEHVMGRKCERLHEAFWAEAYWDEDHLFNHCEMAGLVSMTPRSFWAWVEEWKSKDEESTAKVCSIVLRVYESALDSPTKLQEMLGLGHLTMTARFFSRLPAHDVHTEVDAIFQAILERHPEYSQMFREATHDGTEGNTTTAIGRNIRPRRDRPGVQYVLEDEDMDTL